MKTASKLVALCVLLITLAAAQNIPGTKSAFFTTTDGVKLHYIEAGTGQPIIFVPGWTMPAWIWESQIKQLSKKYHVIALDPRSQGESDKPNQGNYYLRRADDVRDLIADKKLVKPVLIGWSLGVPELVTFADRTGSDNVGAYILVDGFLWDKLDPSTDSEMAQWLVQMNEDREKWSREFVRGPYMFKKPQSEAYLARLEAESKKTPPNSAVSLIMLLGAVKDFTPALKKINRPVVFAHTASEQKTADLIRSVIPGARIESFNDSGHALFVDDADRFNRIVDDVAGAVK